MEDYNEQINFGTQYSPMYKNRLAIRKTTYGYSLYDHKLKKFIVIRKSKNDCEVAMDLLLQGNQEEFDIFMESIKDKVVTENKLILFKGKYVSEYYYINTFEQLGKVCLNVLEKRIDSGHICEWDLPEKLTYNYDGIKDMPEMFRDEATKKLQNYKGRLKEAEENNNMYKTILKAIEEQNGAL
ncbi:MAG: hypothetical protein L0Y61_09285, partial [Epsilonproteobacteria bacterium]|nr:hypothetical protein [Campylobacterota bacterium]